MRIKVFRLFSFLPLEIQNKIILLSEEINCLLVNSTFHGFFSPLMSRKRGKEHGLKLLREGKFLGLVYTRGVNNERIVSASAMSKNERLLDKVMYTEKRSMWKERIPFSRKRKCVGFMEEHALYGACFSGNFKLAKRLFKRHSPNSMSGFQGAVKGGHLDIAKFCWERYMRWDFLPSELIRRNSLENAAFIAARYGHYSFFPFLAKAGAKNFFQALRELCEQGNLGEFVKCISFHDYEGTNDEILHCAIRTKKALFVVECMNAGFDVNGGHLERARNISPEFAQMMRLQYF